VSGPEQTARTGGVPGALRYLWLLTLGRGFFNWLDWMRRSGTVVLALYSAVFGVVVLIGVRQGLSPVHLPLPWLALVAAVFLLSGSLGRWPPLGLDSRNLALLITPQPTRPVLIWPLLRAVLPGVGAATLLGGLLLIFWQGPWLILLLPALMLSHFALGWLNYVARQTPRSPLPIWALATLPALGWLGGPVLGAAVAAVLIISVVLGWKQLETPPARLAQHAGTLWLHRLRRKYKMARVPLRMEQGRPTRRPLSPFPAQWGAAGAVMWRTSLGLLAAPGGLIWGALALSAALVGLSLTTHLSAQLLAGGLSIAAEPFTRLLGPAAARSWPVSKRAAWLGQVLPGSLVGGVVSAALVLIGVLVLRKPLALAGALSLLALVLPLATLSLSAVLERFVGKSSVELRIGSAVGVAILAASLWAAQPGSVLVAVSLLAFALLCRLLTVVGAE
jgi:hypothetical protein